MPIGRAGVGFGSNRRRFFRCRTRVEKACGTSYLSAAYGGPALFAAGPGRYDAGLLRSRTGVQVWRHALALAALALTGIAAATAWRAPGWPDAFVVPAQPPACGGVASFDSQILRRAAPRVAHVASAIALRDGRLRAFWYEGDRELSPDVAIMTATLAAGRWSEPRAIADARSTGAALGRYVRKLGNAVPYRDGQGRLTLVYAGVSLGGWSAASLNIIRSADDGETWSAPRRLVTSPIFNISTLVRSPPVAMRGAALIPAYDEMIKPFPQAIALADDGRVIGIRRIGRQANALQPDFIVTGEKSATAYMRSRGTAKAWSGATTDAGLNWTELSPTRLNSQDSPLMTIDIGDGLLLNVHNAPEIVTGLAGPLTLALSADGGVIWRDIYAFPTDRGDTRYPWLTVGADRNIHLLYTHSTEPGSELVHVRLTKDWLAARGGPACQ